VSGPKPQAKSPPICAVAALHAMARFLRVPPASIATATSQGNNLMPQCSYTAHPGRRQRVEVTANVDTSPSPYFVLERTIEEASQIFGPNRLSAAPINVPGLGLAASWFPEFGWLKATDGRVLVTATVAWNGAKQGRQIALARAVTAPYLTLHGKAAAALAKNYP
jgi:hypothetical protein